MRDLIEPLETIEVLGVRVHKLVRPQLLKFIIKAANSQQKTVIAYVNVHAINLAYKLDWLRDFLNRADLVLCDGFGVGLGARLKGYSFKAEHRMTCPDWIEELAILCQANHLSLFLLAGMPGVADEAAQKLQRVAPRLRVGVYHGYFEKTGPENDRVIGRINAFKPNILAVGFGSPVQEAWIQTNMNRIKAIVFLEVGGCFDYYTGRLFRAPRWMTDHGFEWLSRLLAEPGRLWRRYLVGLPLFFYRLLKSK